MTLSASTSVLSVVGSLLLLQAFVATVHGALPPGYEDHWWCPSSSYCKRRLNKGLECTGRQSAFSDCYDPVTETSVEAVWTGYLSDMDAPEGWVLDPGPCPRTVVVPQVPCGRRGRQYTPSNSSQRVRRLRRLLLAPPRGRRQRWVWSPWWGTTELTTLLNRRTWYINYFYCVLYLTNSYCIKSNQNQMLSVPCQLLEGNYKSSLQL